MKRILLIAIIIATGLTAYPQKKAPQVWLGYPTGNSSNPSFIIGKIKEMTQVTYSAKIEDGKIVKGQKLGYLQSRGNVSYRNATFYFNKAGEITRTVGYDDNNKPAWSAELQNKGGKIQKVSWIVNDTMLNFEIFKYENKILKEVNRYDAKTNELIFKETYQCNKDGFPLKTLGFNGSGEKMTSTEFERDNKNRIVIVKYMNKDDMVVNQVNYSYSVENRFEPASMDTRISNMKEADIKGKRQYEFDKNGNWIRQIRFSGDVPVNITERTYVFY